MNLINFIPTLLAIPTLAVFFLKDRSQLQFIKLNSIGNMDNNVNIESCNCTSKLTISKDMEQRINDIDTKLIEMHIPQVEGSQKKYTQTVKDNLKWTKQHPDFNKWILELNNILGKEAASLLIFVLKLISMFTCHFIIMNTKLGVFIEIVRHHLKQMISDGCKSLLRRYSNPYFSHKIEHSTSSEDVVTESLSEDAFYTNSLDILNEKPRHVDSEELLAKIDQLEEKDFLSRDTGYESSLNLNSTKIETVKPTSSKTEIVPEKLRKFLHQKKESLDRLGISFTSSSDGLVDADDNVEDTFSNLLLGLAHSQQQN